MTCIIFGPYPIDETVIVSGPPDAEAQVYDAGTTYDTGDEVWYGGHAWRSKVDSNTGNTPVAGVNWQDLGEVDYGATEWTAGSYDVQDPRVYYVHNHRIYTTAQDANTDEPGVGAGIESWQDFGPTNRYRAFDESLARAAVGVGSLKWVLQFPKRVLHAVAFLPSGETFSLTKTSDATTIYDNDVGLIKDSGGGFYNYFFAEREIKSNVLCEDMPSILNEQITVEVTNSDDGAVSLAGLHFGFGFEVGPVVAGGGTGITAKGFVQIEFDEFGNRVSPTRPKQKVTRFATRPNLLRTDLIDTNMNALMQETVVAFMRDGEDYGLLAYGLLEGYDIEMPNSVLSELVVKVQGYPR